MKNKMNIFRTIAVCLSILSFLLGITITLGIFMPLTGYVQENYTLFTIGHAVFKTYGFSAFLIPLLFLYASVVLFIPGWPQETASVFLGVPVYFITAVLTERLLYGITAYITIPLIKHFAVSTIIICGLLLICVEIFMMIEFSEAVMKTVKKIIYGDAEEDAPADDAADLPENAAASDSSESTAAATAASAAAPNTAEIRSAQTGISAAKPEYTSGERQPDSNQAAVYTHTVGSSDIPVVDPRAAGEAEAETEKKTDSDSQESAAVMAAVSAQTRPEDFVLSDTEQSLPPTEEAAAGKHIVDAVAGRDSEETAHTVLQSFDSAAASVYDTGESATAVTLAADNKPLPVFDPHDPNNLFSSLEEITADVERIKHTDYSNAAVETPYRNPDAGESTATAQPVKTAQPLNQPSLEQAAASSEQSANTAYNAAPADSAGAHSVAIDAASADTAAAEPAAVKAAPTAPAVQSETEPAAAQSDAAPVEAVMPLATGGKSLPRQEAAAPVLAVTPEATECSAKELPSQLAAASVPPARPASKLFNLDSAMLPEKVRKAVPTSHYPLLDSLIVIERTPLRGSDIREVPVIPEDIVSDAGLEAAAPVSETCMPDCAAVHGGTDIRENPAVPVETTHSVLAHPEGTALVREQVPAEEKPADEHTAGNTAAVDIPAQDDSPEPVQESRPVPQRVSAAAVQEPALVPDAAGTMQNPRTSSGAVAVQTKPASFDTKAQSVSGSSMQGYGVPPQYEPAAVGSESDEDLDDIEDETDEDTIGEDDGVFLEKTPSENIGSPLQPFPPVVSLDAAALPAAVPAAPRKKYSIPFDLLNHYPDGEYWVVDDATRKAAFMLKSTFSEFKIDVSITGIRKGPVVTMFEMLPPPGIKLSKITNLQDNIALRLAASSVRIVAPIPGKHAVGIEVPNKKRSIVSFRELIETDLPESAKMAIPVVLGKDVTGNPQLFDLAQTPHLLIAGATGSGKSVCVNTIILSILYNRRPDEVKLILVDPKIVELKLYNDIAHLLAPVITEPKRAFQALQYSLCEMERRYALLDSMGARDIKTYNKKIKAEKIAAEELPYIVVIIDEFADLMATSGKELEATVARLCAMSRAVGIHLVLATQRPSIDVITGLIKANIPTRIAFMVASKTDSRIILDEVGAEKLLGKGDMLYVSAAQLFPARMQGAFVSEEEVERVVACVKDYCEPEYIDDEIFVDDDDDSYEHVVFSDDNDPLYDQALEIVTFAGKASASYVQRKLKIGYNRAARLIEEMEANGIVGPANGSKPREILRR